MNIRTPELTDLPALHILWQKAFGDTKEFIQSFFSIAFDYRRCFCAVDKGVLTAALYWFDCVYQNRPVAYLYAIATSEDYQGQGICHKLMEHTHRHLLHTGYAGTVLVPGNATLFEFYKGMGYEVCCYVNEYHYVISPDTQTFTNGDCSALLPNIQGTNTCLQLRPITTAEYTALRSKLLPKKSILQDGISLAFLEAQTQLFAGEDFIMAAHIENGRLFVPELLGNISHPSQLLYTLNCKEGLLRTPGTQKPFAMYLSLSDNELPKPAYFGLAFD